jgi:hypothetical protein
MRSFLVNMNSIRAWKLVLTKSGALYMGRRPSMKRFTAMMTIISEVAGFGATVNFREAVRPEPGGPVAVVQAKDIGQDGTLDLSAVARVDTPCP